MRPPQFGRAVVLMPNGFTMANLCFGMLAIIYAAKSDFSAAGLCVVLGGVADVLDGRVARATRSGSRFGEELDSLADLVSFGVAPAMIMYFAVLRDYPLDWLWAFVFIGAAAIRLARFNVEQAGRPKSHFYGLPSPAAGMTLATYWWFSQTSLYTDTFIGTLPWQQTMRIVMIALAVLMMSTVQYPTVPSVGIRTLRGIIGLLVVLGTLAGVAFFPRQFFFPALVTYVAYGLLKTAIAGMIDHRLTPEPAGSTPYRNEPGDDASAQGEVESERTGMRRRRRRRRKIGPGGPGPHGSRRDTPQSHPPVRGGEEKKS